jgi:hypothetical protein
MGGQGVSRQARSAARALDLDAVSTKEVDTLLPTLARDPLYLARVDAAVAEVPTAHRFRVGDARDLGFLPDASVHPVVTSPPYWTLKEYHQMEGPLVMSRTTAPFKTNWTGCGANASAS